ncbi:putative protein kinase RLK-Pelle-SD-2b family [Helianthus annuus]|nr:putative protein kinase RLK-Pelle-SD-2b family [Helianthus annuus]
MISMPKYLILGCLNLSTEIKPCDDKNERNPGYMAPEWLSSVITEKVDVYSFGIVLLEILCGRRNFDRSQPEESWHLLGVFQQCWEQGTLLDIVDKYSEYMQHRYRCTVR